MLKALWAWHDRGGPFHQCVTLVLFTLYFPPFVCFFIAHLVLWKLHAGFYGARGGSDRSVIAVLATTMAIGGGAALVWTFRLLGLIFSAILGHPVS
jgi:hypothetical protein